MSLQSPPPTQPVEVARQLKRSLESISGEVDVLIGIRKSKKEASSLTRVSKDLSNVEDAKLNVSLAYTAASLYYILLNAKGGENAEQHSVHNELKRIKTYVEKLKTVEANARGVEAQEEPRRAVSINVSAAERVIAKELGRR